MLKIFNKKKSIVFKFFFLKFLFFFLREISFGRACRELLKMVLLSFYVSFKQRYSNF